MILVRVEFGTSLVGKVDSDEEVTNETNVFSAHGLCCFLRRYGGRTTEWATQTLHLRNTVNQAWVERRRRRSRCRGCRRKDGGGGVASRSITVRSNGRVAPRRVVRVKQRADAGRSAGTGVGSDRWQPSRCLCGRDTRVKSMGWRRATTTTSSLAPSALRGCSGAGGTEAAADLRGIDSQLILLHGIVLGLDVHTVRVGSERLRLFRSSTSESLDTAVAVSTSIHRSELRNDGGTTRDTDTVEGRLMHLVRDGGVGVVVRVVHVTVTVVSLCSTRELSDGALGSVAVGQERLVETKNVGETVLRERRKVKVGVVALRRER